MGGNTPEDTRRDNCHGVLIRDITHIYFGPQSDTLVHKVWLPCKRWHIVSFTAQGRHRTRAESVRGTRPEKRTFDFFDEHDRVALIWFMALQKLKIGVNSNKLPNHSLGLTLWEIAKMKVIDRAQLGGVSMFQVCTDAVYAASNDMNTMGSK